MQKTRFTIRLAAPEAEAVMRQAAAAGQAPAELLRQLVAAGLSQANQPHLAQDIELAERLAQLSTCRPAS